MSYMTNIGKQALLWFLLWLAMVVSFLYFLIVPSVYQTRDEYCTELTRCEKVHVNSSVCMANVREKLGAVAIVLASLTVVPPLIIFMVGVNIIGRKYQGTIFVPCKEVIQKPVLHDGIDMCRLLADFVDDVTLGNDRQPWPSGFFFGIVGGALYRYHIEGVKDIVEEGCQRIGEPIDHWDLIVGDMDDARNASDDTLRIVLERISETIKLPKYKGKICVHLDQFLPSSLFGNLNNYPPFAERLKRIPLTAFPMYGKNGAEERPLYMGSVYDGMWFYEHGACAKHLKDKHIQRLNALQGKFMGGKYAAH